MKKIQKGIYRLDGEIERVNDYSLVLVHPWYFECGTGHSVFEGERDYNENLSDLLKGSSERNLFLFEEKKICKNTARRVRGLRGSRGLYVIPTLDSNPEPKLTSWTEVLSFMKLYGRDVQVAGGYLWCYISSEKEGCLGILLIT